MTNMYRVVRTIIRQYAAPDVTISEPVTFGVAIRRLVNEAQGHRNGDQFLEDTLYRFVAVNANAMVIVQVISDADYMSTAGAR